MKYDYSWTAISIFGFFVAFVLGLSFYLGRKATSAKGYYAAHGQIGWFVNGVAFAGDYLSAASFLGICGMIAFYGYDGFLYSIGYLAGWVVALFVIAEPIKRLGKFTFADALDSRFNSRGIKLAVAISTLIVSIFYLIPQMVGAGALITPLLGLDYHWGVLIVGAVVTLIVVTAGMVSTTWVQFIKGSLLVIFCFVLTCLILARGLTTHPPVQTTAANPYRANAPITVAALDRLPGLTRLPPEGDWGKKSAADFLRTKDASGRAAVWHVERRDEKGAPLSVSETQVRTMTADGKTLVNYQPQGWDAAKGEADFYPVGRLVALPEGKTETGPLGPAEYLATLQRSTIETWSPSAKIVEPAGETTVYFRKILSGADALRPGGSPTFAGVRSADLSKKLDFFSLMLALFCGTASLPHILIRYYTVKDQASARKSTVVGIASIGFFYVLTLYLGLGAMTSGGMDVTDQNMAAPLLAKSFNTSLFAIISAIAFTTVLGTVSGLIMAGAGAVAHDLMENFLRIKMDDRQKVFYGKVAAVVLGGIAMVLGVMFHKLNPTFLVGWAFNIAASANLPSLVMLLFWRGTTKRGIVAAVTVGMVSSLGWILLSAQCYRDVYGLDPARSIVPFSQPGLVTIPLGFVVLVVVSLLTRRGREETPPADFAPGVSVS